MELQGGERLRTLMQMGFSPISTTEYLSRNSHDIRLLQKKTSRILPTAFPGKRLRGAGKSKAEPNVNFDLDDALSSDDRDAEDGKQHGSRRPSTYKCWFNEECWPRIESTLRLNQYKFRPTVSYLQRKYEMPGCEGMFQRLNESTLRGWFEADGRTLKPKPQAAVHALQSGIGDPKSIMRRGRLGKDI